MLGPIELRTSLVFFRSIVFIGNFLIFVFNPLIVNKKSEEGHCSAAAACSVPSGNFAGSLDNSKTLISNNL